MQLGYRFIKVTGLPSESYLYNVLIIYAVHGIVLVCYYANEIKFKLKTANEIKQKEDKQTRIREKALNVCLEVVNDQTDKWIERVVRRVLFEIDKFK